MHNIFSILYFVAFLKILVLLSLNWLPLCQNPQFEKYFSRCFKSFPFHLSCVDMAFPGAVPSLSGNQMLYSVWPTSDRMEVRKRRVSFLSSRREEEIQRWERWAEAKQRELTASNHWQAGVEWGTHWLLLTQGTLEENKYYCPHCIENYTQIKNNKLKSYC